MWNQITRFLSAAEFCAVFLIYNASAHSQISINEFMASNVANIADPQYNEYSDWIELYNAGTASVNLSGWYLSDQQGSVPGWRFPANTIIQPHAFLLIWADGRNTGLHTDFKLSADGEEVVLYDDQSVMKDDIVFGAQRQDISYGRKTNGGTPWGLFAIPTPGSSNNNSRFYSSSVEQVPVFSISGGFYTGPVSVLIEDMYHKGTIRYTVDGSEPSDNSPVFSVPLNITKNSVVRARMFYTDQIPGPVVTNTYFVNEHFEERGLPVLSLSTKPDYFYGKDSGLYVQNFKPEWEYPLHLEFYQKDGIFGFHHDAGVQIGGLNAWILPQKLLNIYSRKIYGAGHFDFQLFNTIQRKQYGDFILRCSGNDWSNTFFRDGMMQGLIKDYADLDGQSFRPVSVFINGQYLGMHNLREKQDADYCQYHHGINPDSLDYIENNTEIKEGNLDLYNQMVAMLNAGVITDGAFRRLDSVMDTHNYTDYIISQIFTANTSWGHNVSCFRHRGQYGRWRWLLHDYDRGFDLANVTGTGMNWATATNGQDYSNPAWATLFLRKMLENNAYKQSFITRFADHLFVTYHPATINAKVQYHAGLIRGEMPYQIERWKGTTSSYGNAIPTLQFWENEVNKLVQYGQQRNAFMWSDLNRFFGLSSTGLTVSLSKPQAGYVKIHDLKIPSYPWSGQYFQKRDITLTAFAKSGYQFDHWERVITRDTILLAAGSKWKYRDAATAPPSDWMSNSFNDNAWSSGYAELGYGDGDEVTVLSYGSDANNKIPSYYFRSNFNVKDPSSISDFILRIKADDGAVAYVNGKEAGRVNMPAAPIAIGFDTLALSSVSGTAETSFTELSVPVSLLKNGTNFIAVEVHQASRNSSDVSFDAEVIVRTTGNSMYLSNKPSYTFQLDSTNWNINTVFNPDGHCGILPDSIIENTTLTASCSPYIAGGNVFVKQGIHLIVEKGVAIRFPEGSSLYVNGDIQINGTQQDPVLISAISDSVQWGGIFLHEPTADCQMQYLQLVGAGAGTDRTYFPAAISAYRAVLRMDHLDLTQVTDNPVFSRFSHVELTNSNIKTSVTGDGINIKQGYGKVENCIFEGGHAVDMDAIDYDGVQGGIVRNNIIHDFRGDNNDGLDIGEHCENLMIENNFIYHCYDKGISVGQRSSATVRNNAIAYTSIGIALKDQSPVVIDHCTFFGNQQGISAYEKNAGFLGGTGQVTNCIVSNAYNDAYIADQYSGITLNHCQSDLDSSGVTQGDIILDPHFANPTWYDFHLQNNSQAAGAGNDGKDLGSLFIPAYTGQPQILISEILYNDSMSILPEFVELYNPGDKSIDLSNYVLTEAIEFTFPSGTKLKSKDALVVTRDATAFSGVPYQVFEWESGKLRNEGERITLLDADGLLIDFVNYNNKAPWPAAELLNGSSIELFWDNLDNHFGTSWKKSERSGGTPGKFSDITAVKEDDTSNFHIYPQPASEQVFIETGEELNGGLWQLNSLLGQPIGAGKINSSRMNISLKELGAVEGTYELIVASSNGIRRKQNLIVMMP